MKYIEELKELAKLKDDGILTEDEFQKKKEEILSKSTPSKPIAKKSLKEQEQIKEGILSKIMISIFNNRTKSALELFKDNPKLQRSVRAIEREKKEMERLRRKYPKFKGSI